MRATQDPFSIRQVVKTCRTLQRDLSQTAAQAARNTHGALPGPDPFREARGVILTSLEKITAILSQHQKTPGHLPPPTRRAFQWLTFLSSPENFDEHTQVLMRCHRLLSRLRIPNKYRRYQPEISLYHISPLYRIRFRRKVLEIKIQQGFLGAPDEMFLAVLQIALGKDRKSFRNTIQHYAQTKDFQQLRERLEYLGIDPQTLSEGEKVNLMPVFHRVNERFFQGKLSPPHLVWSRVLTYRKFGHYQFDTDTVMISRSVDQEDVPDYVLDYLMYHELLHKILGRKELNGRQYAHTPVFKDKEHLFPRHQEARDYLEALSRKIQSA